MVDTLNFLNSDTFLKVLSFGSAFLAAFLLGLTLLPDERKAWARRRLGVAEDVARPKQVFLLKWLGPIYRVFVPYLAARNLERKRTVLHKKLVSANLREEITPDEFLGFKLTMAVLIPLLLGYLSGASGRPVPPMAWPILVMGGYFFPDLWLKQRIELRRRAILRALPYTLDLLTLSVEAGLDFVAAMARLTQRAKENALLVEFNHMLREIRLGTARSDALKSLSERLQIEEISSLTTLLVQADQLGAPIGHVLRAQSDQLRARRFQAAEAAGAKASQLILFPLVVCIFPAIFIVVLGPVVLDFLAKGFF